jgi:hypothetical protein
MMIRRSIALALFLGLLTGCSTMSLQELRQQAPARSATVTDRQVDVLAGCVVEGLQLQGERPLFGIGTSDLTYQVNRRPEQGRTTVTGYEPDGPSRLWPMLDLTFTQQDRAVLVESRIGDFAGGTGGMRSSRRLNELAWPIIEKCADGGKLAGPQP